MRNSGPTLHLLDSSAAVAADPVDLVAIDPFREDPIVVRVRDWASEHERLADLIGALRRRVPGATLILWPDFCSLRDAMLAIALSRGLGIRGWTLRPIGNPVDLRADLALDFELGEYVARWRRETGRIAPAAQESLRRLLCASPSRPTVSAAAMRLGVTPRALRKAHAAQGLEGPATYLRLLAAVRVALWIIRHPELRRIDAARKLGYANERGLTKALKVAFGITWTDVTSKYGPDPFLARWYRTVGAR